ncbi:adenosylmethionine decarboxylase [Neolewinella aurantiaca]|uniref:S-adenosylmethionine decarboxylase proenzyme n=1 Tax=Neolewinella aurantiaca TaxID=2602767 RepID=A0A5C7FT30_9BACT|nr:adenosylmethionine decarboxylase [Neolewinella aurantiaca]TXF89435.1 adenosylmethionine decarboxylase [Neolewinella aurantiaca]
MPAPKSFPLPPGTKVLGRHVHLDLYECTAGILSAPADSERILNAAAHEMNATIVGSHFHAFNPHGVSGVVVIAESHLTVHTWPEHNYAAIDIFSCGDLDLDAGIKLLIAEFGARRHYLAAFDRGWVNDHSSGG